MTLTLAYLAQIFPEATLCCKFPQNDRSLWALSDMKNQEQSILHIGTETEYMWAGFTGSFAVIAGDQLPVRDDDCVLRFPPTTNFYELRQQMNDVFSDYHRLLEHMERLRMASYNASLRMAVAEISRIFLCSALICNALGSILASTVEEYSSSGTAPSYYYTNAAILTDGDSLVELLGQGLDSVVGGIILDKEPVAYLCLTEIPKTSSRFKRELCSCIIQTLVTILKQLDLEKPGQKFASELFMTELMHDVAMSDQTLYSKAALAGFSTKGSFSIFLLDMTLQGLSRPQMIRIIDQIELTGNIIPVMENGILCLLLILSDPGQLNKRVQDIINQTESLQCRGVYSRVFGDIRAFYPIYQRMLHALTLIDKDSESRIVGYDQLEWQTLVQSLGFRGITELHPAVQQLLEADQNHKFSYTETLYTYLCCSQRPNETCEKLNIHRNTFEYRMGKILELTDLDLKDGKLMALVLLSLDSLRILDEPVSGSQKDSK